MSSIIIDAPTGNGAGGNLVAYSSFEPYELVDYQTALARDLPDIALRIERMPTAVLTRRLLDEVHSPQADLVLGWADTAAGTKGLEGIAISGDTDGWVRPTGFSTAFVMDMRLMAERGIEDITGWESLVDSRLAGMIAWPDPRISGAGFLALATVLQRFGEKQGWDMVQSIHRNVVVTPSSAWEPARLVGGGAVAVGVTVRIAAIRRQQEAPELLIGEPVGATGTEAEVYGVLRASSQQAAAGRVIDWILSPACRLFFEAHHKIDLRRTDSNLFNIDVGHAVLERMAMLDRYTHMMGTSMQQEKGI